MACLIPGSQYRPDRAHVRKKFSTDVVYRAMKRAQTKREAFHHIDRFEFDLGLQLQNGRPDGEAHGVRPLNRGLRRIQTAGSALLPPTPTRTHEYGAVSSHARGRLKQIVTERRLDDFYGGGRVKRIANERDPMFISFAKTHDERTGLPIREVISTPIRTEKLRPEAEALDYDLLPEKSSLKRKAAYFWTYGRGNGDKLQDPILRAMQPLAYRSTGSTVGKGGPIVGEGRVAQWQLDDIPVKSNYRGRPHTVKSLI